MDGYPRHRPNCRYYLRHGVFARIVYTASDCKKLIIWPVHSFQSISGKGIKKNGSCSHVLQKFRDLVCYVLSGQMNWDIPSRGKDKSLYCGHALPKKRHGTGEPVWTWEAIDYCSSQLTGCHGELPCLSGVQNKRGFCNRSVQ